MCDYGTPVFFLFEGNMEGESIAGGALGIGSGPILTDQR